MESLQTVLYIRNYCILSIMTYIFDCTLTVYSNSINICVTVSLTVSCSIRLSRKMMGGKTWKKKCLKWDFVSFEQYAFRHQEIFSFVNNKIQQVEEFKNPGYMFTEDEKLDREIDVRTLNAITYQQSPPVSQPNITLKTKRPLINSTFIPTLCY